MKIMIAGLGLIGGSMAKSLARAGYSADGFDRAPVLRRAEEEGVVARAAADTRDYDVVFVALPPDAAMEYIGGHPFREGAVIADICGVKGALEKFVYSQPRAFRYVGCHPMAGKEVSGLENSDASLFDGASMIIAENEHTDAEAVSIVSNAYVKSPTADGFPGFTGGSFQDMTRIAGVDESVWTRLYMLNREAVTEELRRLVGHLNEYLAALERGNEGDLCGLLKEGRLRKEQLDAERKIL